MFAHPSPLSPVGLKSREKIGKPCLFRSSLLSSANTVYDIALGDEQGDIKRDRWLRRFTGAPDSKREFSRIRAPRKSGAIYGGCKKETTVKSYYSESHFRIELCARFRGIRGVSDMSDTPALGAVSGHRPAGDAFENYAVLAITGFYRAVM